MVQNINSISIKPQYVVRTTVVRSNDFVRTTVHPFEHLRSNHCSSVRTHPFEHPRPIVRTLTIRTPFPVRSDADRSNTSSRSFERQAAKLQNSYRSTPIQTQNLSQVSRTSIHTLGTSILKNGEEGTIKHKGSKFYQKLKTQNLYMYIYMHKRLDFTFSKLDLASNGSKSALSFLSSSSFLFLFFLLSLFSLSLLSAVCCVWTCLVCVW